MHGIAVGGQVPAGRMPRVLGFLKRTAWNPSQWAGEEGWKPGPDGPGTSFGVMPVKNEWLMTLIVLIVTFVLGLVLRRPVLWTAFPNRDQSSDSLHRGDAALGVVPINQLAPLDGSPPGPPGGRLRPRLCCLDR